jgi:hypothetical protein
MSDQRSTPVFINRAFDSPISFRYPAHEITTFQKRLRQRSIGLRTAF